MITFKKFWKIELNTIVSYNAATEHYLVQYFEVMIEEVLPHLLSDVFIFI